MVYGCNLYRHLSSKGVICDFTCAVEMSGKLHGESEMTVDTKQRVEAYKISAASHLRRRYFEISGVS
jgi:hypothetical protein